LGSAPHLQLPWRLCLSSAARCSVPSCCAPCSRVSTSATSSKKSNSFDSQTDSMSYDNPLALAFLGDAIWSVSSCSVGPVPLVQCCAGYLQPPPAAAAAAAAAALNSMPLLLFGSCIRSVTLFACTLAQHTMRLLHVNPPKLAGTAVQVCTAALQPNVYIHHLIICW
jgi:hypothetical protein